MQNFWSTVKTLTSAFCTLSNHENVGRCWGVLWEVMKYDDFTLAVETNAVFDVSKQACSGNFHDSCWKIVFYYSRFHSAYEKFRCFFGLFNFYTCSFCFAGLLSNLTFCLWIFCWCLACSRAWIIKFIIHVQKVIEEEFYCSHMFSPIKLWRILMFYTLNFQLQVWNKLCQWWYVILNVWYW